MVNPRSRGCIKGKGTKRGVCHMNDFQEHKSENARTADSFEYSSISSDDSRSCDLYDTSEGSDIEYGNVSELCGKNPQDSRDTNNGKAPPQCTKHDWNKENKITRQGFGQSFVEPRKRAKERKRSPADKPMILSRRMSFKIMNPALSPLRSPITAVKLMFSPGCQLATMTGQWNSECKSSVRGSKDKQNKAKGNNSAKPSRSTTLHSLSATQKKCS